MQTRVRQSRLSLAAKCQLLFGAAVVLTIAAALFVPWQRMEQLTEQLDERTAAALANNAISEHVTRQMARQREGRPPRSLPIPEAAPLAVGDQYLPPRIIPASAADKPDQLGSLDRRALGHLLKSPERDHYFRYYDRKGDVQGYYYAVALRARGQCLDCHQEAMMAAAPTTLAATTQPARLLGMVAIDIPSQIDSNQLLLNRVFILSAALLAGTLALLVFYYTTSKLILHPVRVLQDTAEKVSRGDLNIRCDISTGDEFQQLAETLNTMLTNLKAGEDQLRAINKSLDLKLGQLAESNVALYESNRLKSEFLANVSHELRTPLNSILGFADLLKDAQGANPDAKTLRYVQNILSSGRNLLDLINDLLDLAKIEAGRMEVRSEPLSLNDLFEGLSSILKPLAENKNLNIVPSVAADVPILHTDPAKLQQILYNFMANAIKFSPVSGQIDLAAQRHGEENVRISVTDRGPGIEPDKQEIIFEKFRQIDGSHTRQHSGTGLGLAISKELVLLLGGSIGVRSTPGEGATFWIVLPLKTQPGTQDVRKKLVLT